MSISTKQEVLGLIESNRNDWMDNGTYSVHTIDSVSLEDTGVYVDGMGLSERAVSKMLYRMQLTNKFIDYKRQVEENDFKTVFGNIVKWNQGKQIITRSNGNTVSDVFFYTGSEDFNSGSRLSMIIDGVYDKVSQMSDDIEIHKFEIDTASKNIKFSTVDPTTKFNAIGSDEWVLGSILSIGLTEGFASPYYGRLICSNGLVDGVKMRKSSLTGKGYTEESIRQLISKGTSLKKLVGDHIKEVSREAVQCDVSLSEYLSLRKIMAEGLHEEQKHVVDQLFPLDHIEDAYGGKEVFNNNDQWKRTAKSGATVYELLNDITKWTTHDTSINNRVMKDRLNEKASIWFMKGEWHNRNVAPVVELHRKPKFSDSVVVF
jgi:hypothetical protein